MRGTPWSTAWVQLGEDAAFREKRTVAHKRSVYLKGGILKVLCVRCGGELLHIFGFYFQAILAKTRSVAQIYVIPLFVMYSHVFLNRVQQTLSGSAPPQHPPDTITLHSENIARAKKNIEELFSEGLRELSQSIAWNNSWGIAFRVIAHFCCCSLFSYCFCCVLPGIDLRNGHFVIAPKYFRRIISGWIARNRVIIARNNFWGIICVIISERRVIGHCLGALWGQKLCLANHVWRHCPAKISRHHLLDAV